MRDVILTIEIIIINIFKKELLKKLELYEKKNDGK